MQWVLILAMAMPGQPPVAAPAGIMRDENTCKVAGAGMAIVLSQANPGLVVGFRCEQTGEAT